MTILEMQAYAHGSGLDHRQRAGLVEQGPGLLGLNRQEDADCRGSLVAGGWPCGGLECVW